MITTKIKSEIKRVYTVFLQIQGKTNKLLIHNLETMLQDGFDLLTELTTQTNFLFTKISKMNVEEDL